MPVTLPRVYSFFVFFVVGFLLFPTFSTEALFRTTFNRTARLEDLMQKAQVAVEYMAVVALSLFVLLLIGAYVNTVRQSVDQEVRMSLANQAVDRLAEAVRLVSVQGPPAKVFVEINNPEGVVAVGPPLASACNTSEVMLVVSNLQGGVAEVYRYVPVNVSGDLSSLIGKESGMVRIFVEATVSNGQSCVLFSGSG